MAGKEGAPHLRRTCTNCTKHSARVAWRGGVLSALVAVVATWHRGSLVLSLDVLRARCGAGLSAAVFGRRVFSENDVPASHRHRRLKRGQCCEVTHPHGAHSFPHDDTDPSRQCAYQSWVQYFARMLVSRPQPCAR